MLMDVGLDTGPMLLKHATPSAPMGILPVCDRMALLGAELLAETLDGLRREPSCEPQDDQQSCYAPLLKRGWGDRWGAGSRHSQPGSRVRLAQCGHHLRREPQLFVPAWPAEAERQLFLRRQESRVACGEGRC